MNCLLTFLICISSNLDTLNISKLLNEKKITINKSNVLITAIITTFISFLGYVSALFIKSLIDSSILNLFSGLLLIFLGFNYITEQKRLTLDKLNYDTSGYCVHFPSSKEILYNLDGISKNKFLDFEDTLKISYSLSINNFLIFFSASIATLNLEIMFLINFLITILFLYFYHISILKSVFSLFSKYNLIICALFLIISGLIITLL